MELFIAEGLKVMPYPSTLLIEPFSSIANKYNVEQTLLIFAYIEFNCSYKKSNPFVEYDDNIKSSKITESIDPTGTILFPNGQDDLLTDYLVAEGINKYNELQDEAAVTIRFYKSALTAASKLTTFFDTLDMTSMTRSGTPVYKPADITRALKDTNEVLKTLSSLRRTIYQELAESSKGKGGRTINHFEKATDDK